jgi:hypothetical protein
MLEPRATLAPAQLEPLWPRQRLAEDQASPVVEGFESLGIELVRVALLTAGLRRGGFGWPTPYRLPIHAAQPAARDEFRLLWCATHLFLLSWFY